MSKLSSKQYNKLVRTQHDWKVSYTDVATGKEVTFTCSNIMKCSHEILMKDNQFVRNVKFMKGI